VDNAGEVLLLSRDDVNKVLTARDCIDRCVDTFRWVGEGKVTQVNPVNLYLQSRDEPEPPFGHGILQAFPAEIKPLKVGGVKWLGGYRLNRKRGLPAISAIDIINDTETAMPLAIVDGTSVTNMRTAGHAGVGAKYLARPDSSVIAIIGCGHEGRTHLRVMNELFGVEEVRIFDVVPEMAAAFQAEMSQDLGLNIKIYDSVQAAVDGADVVCIVTTATEPVLMVEWVKPGCHVCACTGFRDVDHCCGQQFDKWVVGWYGRDLEWIEGPEVGKIGGLKPGRLCRKDIYADLATEIIPGKKPAWESDQERTIMTHLGMPALDAAVAALVYEKAKEQGVGTTFKVF
jgi:ornithine cyclodeaminase/alanine dehydrogenase-like protein (mu-crystallin family)